MYFLVKVRNDILHCRLTPRIILYTIEDYGWVLTVVVIEVSVLKRLVIYTP